MLEAYDDLLTPEDCMEILQIGRNQIYTLLAEGELKAFRIGSRRWKIPKESVILFIRTQANLL